MTRLLALAALLLVPATAAAEVTRYAVIVGQNAGQGDEEILRYAADDARRLRDVLVDLGGFLPENVILARAAQAETFRAALIRMNDRIRTAGTPAMLVVFYSGHADAGALHLDGSELPVDQLEQLVRGSAAAFRLLIVDACRSGSLTRVKGGTRVPAPPIELGQRLPTDGVVFWTSSSANEDAQESDELRGSFFTHYLVSGLLGAADTDDNGAVTLGEAYDHAYEQTLRATSKTLAGAQHATFRHDTRGMADIALTSLAGPDRALLTFGAGHDYLILAGGSDGDVVAEVGARDAERRVSLRPGRYFVRGRARDHLLEGSLTVRAGEQRQLDEGALERVAYARLVRKGAGARQRSDSLEAGYTVRTPLWRGAALCHGVVVGWTVDTPILSLAARGLACRSGFDNRYLEATSDELGAELRVVHAWDLRRVTVSGGALAGASLLSQRFDSSGAAPARTSGAAHLGVTASFAVDVASDLYVALEADGLTSFFAQKDDDGSSGRAVFSARGNLLVGKRW